MRQRDEAAGPSFIPSRGFSIAGIRFRRSGLSEPGGRPRRLRCFDHDYVLRFSSHPSDLEAVQSLASESDSKEPMDSMVPSGHSASTDHSLASSFLSSRGLKIGLGYFFAIPSDMRPPAAATSPMPAGSCRPVRRGETRRA
jgi:hypothetical protein